MAYVITQRCCNDARCIPECPVDCIRPKPGDPNYTTAEMLYIDPESCIDCGACAEVCPVSAIFPEDELLTSLERFQEINASYFDRHPLVATVDRSTRTGQRDKDKTLRPPKELGVMKVAIVGAGPSSCYAAEELLKRGNVEVSMFERLPAPWGLVRTGVAPDHLSTKGITRGFERAFRNEAFAYYLNVEVGAHISHQELLDHHHAVIYGVGASTDRLLGIPGEGLAGSHSATEFLAWANGHPDRADESFDLSGERAVIVGNGNVALDVARILLLDRAELATTDIADHALEALRRSNIREVVVLGRRGPVQAAYSSAEFMALGHLRDVDVIVDKADLQLDVTSQRLVDDPEVEASLTLKVALAKEFAENRPVEGGKRIVFMYLSSPVELLGEQSVAAVRVVRNELVESEMGLHAVPTDDVETLATSLVFRSIGYRGTPVAGLPFDHGRGTVLNQAGRVLDEGGAPWPGTYVTGWIKRGSLGGIGSNRSCAVETVDRLLEDFIAGRLDEPVGSRDSLTALVRHRQPDVLGRTEWRAIDQAELESGKDAGRPRVKFTNVVEMVEAGRVG
jgi:ferredoxin--NADP+ reductase